MRHRVLEMANMKHKVTYKTQFHLFFLIIQIFLQGTDAVLESILKNLFENFHFNLEVRIPGRQR